MQSIDHVLDHQVTVRDTEFEYFKSLHSETAFMCVGLLFFDGLQKGVTVLSINDRKKLKDIELF